MESISSPIVLWLLQADIAAKATIAANGITILTCLLIIY